MKTILPLYYFGNIAYWKTIFTEEYIQLSIHHTIQKKSYANRSIILSANGLQTLSVPLIGGRGSKIPFDQLEISYAENWVAKHKMALQSAYSKSPYYEYYMPYFEQILDKRHSKLAQLNLELFTEILKRLKHPIHFNETHENPTENYIPNQFDSRIVEYSQVFGYKFSFQPDLSILDMLFCIGPETKEILLTSREYVLPKQ